ncbi:MAG: TonB-dependent receptor, partial [Gammaproteobacteria bacterium]|nr:TonB-dependent receptor [Gammaproteobacteria bacterium]
RLGYNDYEHKEFEGEETGTVFENNELDARFELVHAPIKDWRGAFGIQIRDREFSAVGEEAFVPPTDSQSIGVFLVEEREINDWRVEFGGRFETQDQDPENAASESDSTFSFSAGGLYKFNDEYSLGLNFTRAQRAPEIEERFANGPHLATSQFEIGDPGLTEETAHNLDVTLRKHTGRLQWTVNVYRNEVDDFIFLQATGDEEDGLPVFQHLQADAEFTGYEAEVKFPLAETDFGNFDLRVFSDYVRGKLADGGDLPRVPPLRLGANLEFKTNNWIAGFEVIEYDEQDDTADLELPTDSYTMVNANVSYRLFRPHLDWTFFLRANNLMDEEARRHTSFLKDIAPLPGRNFTLGARLNF